MLTDAECRNVVRPPDRKYARFSDARGLLRLQAVQACSAQLPIG